MPNWTQDAVGRAMVAVPRAGFLPPELREHADLDRPLPIGLGQTNSQPTTVAIMLRLLETRPGQRILDVGAGSGWTTALLAELVGQQGRVIGVERHARLIEPARIAVARHAGGRAEIRLATPGVLGAPEDGPFNRILVSAEATRLPSALVDQLDDGGVMVIPVNQTMLRVTRHGTEITVTRHGAFVFVPLVEE